MPPVQSCILFERCVNFVCILNISATFAFVETVPKDFGESMEFYPRTHEMWIQLLRSANSSIQIVTPYIDLTGGVSQGTGTEVPLFIM